MNLRFSPKYDHEGTLDGFILHEFGNIAVPIAVVSVQEIMEANLTIAKAQPDLIKHLFETYAEPLLPQVLTYVPDPESLKALREQWETGLEVKCVIPNDTVVIVVLIDENDKYHLHRYVAIADRWDVSTDVQGDSLGNVWSQLAEALGDNA